MCLAYLLHRLISDTNSVMEDLITFLVIFTKFVIVPVIFSYIKNAKMTTEWQTLGFRVIYGAAFFLFSRYLNRHIYIYI